MISIHTPTALRQCQETKLKIFPRKKSSQDSYTCHDNAKKLLEAGKLLFNNKFTAYANSLVILAVEEEIKGFIIYGVILNPEFSQSLDFEALFGKHKIKKEVAKAEFWYWENLARHIKQVGVDNFLNNPEIHLESFLQSEVTTGTGSSTKTSMKRTGHKTFAAYSRYVDVNRESMSHANQKWDEMYTSILTEANTST